jgi:integrase
VRGHLEARGKNVWRAKVYLGRDAEQRKLYVTRTIHGTKRQAEDALNALLVETGGSEPIADGSFAELAERWLALASGTLSPTTLAEYRRLLDKIILPRFGSTKLRSLRTSDLDAFYAQLGRRGVPGGRPLGAQSIRHVHALLRRLLNQAAKWGWIAVNPAANASPPKVYKQDLQLPSPDAVIAILAAAREHDPDLGCFLRLSAVTGARRGEVCALRWSDLDGKGTLRIRRAIVGDRSDELVEKDTKTHAARRIALDQATLASLAEHRERCQQRAKACGTSLRKDAFVFSTSVDGETPWRPSRVTLAFIRLCRREGVEGVRLHDLRHFAATQMLVAGVPVKTVAGRLGHANAATTLNVYAHFVEESDENAANVLGDLLRGG